MASSSSSLRHNSTSTFLNNDPNASEALYQVKLLSALRSGEPALIHPFLTEISKDKRKSTEGDIDTGAAALHLAVRCASIDTVALFLSHRAISPNGVHPPGSGTTALHLAASLGRADVVNLLLEQEGIDDGLRDAQGKTCRDVAKGKDVLRAIDDSRAFLNASYRSLLHSYIHSPAPAQPPPALLQLLHSPRIRTVDLSYLDDDAGAALLHEAARRKDLRLIELAVRAGADVFVRNRKGKTPSEGAKDERVRVFLRQFANHDTTLIEPPTTTPGSEAPTLRGYLNKYTNVAKGYNTRYFVLKDGVLSYYRSQEDEHVSSRGSIAMRTALLKLPSSTPQSQSPALKADRLRFEIHSPAAGSKWYLKANHPVEAARWARALGASIEWARANNRNSEGERRSGESERGTPREDRRSISSGLGLGLFRSKRGSGAGRSKQALSLGSDDNASWGGGESAEGEGEGGSPDAEVGDAEREGEGEGEGEESEERESGEDGDDGGEGDDAGFELLGNSLAAQVELTCQLVGRLSLGGNENDGEGDGVSAAMADLLALTQTYVASSRRRLRRAREERTFWEESLRSVVREGAGLEQELRVRSRRRGSRLFGGDVGLGVGEMGMGMGTGMGTVKAKRGPRVPEEEAEQVQTPTAGAQPPSFIIAMPPPTPPPPAARPAILSSNTADTVVPASASSMMTVLTSESDLHAYDPDTDEEDEFFDAIESNTLPNLHVPASLASPSSLSPSPSASLVLTGLSIPLEQYAAYTTLRTQLSLKDDERPSTSLWSVLKHSIGKDLTKISFPVFFNEPTSMLQRMAEDMEFSECLDTATRQTDPQLRLAYVAAFAMSNYSSTIGRIAKPFNPMLGETFEYVRIDKEYRYLSEQVSHHPPISACWAEAPDWRYYGEVDAQNKFMGKSFEIRPTGVAHAELLLPEEMAPNYPKASGKTGVGKVVEHYSWKKVTTNVSGFILGSPTIDHYGEMTVTNHRTKDKCTLTFKPRGWRGKDAYEIIGKVTDAAGDVAYEIAGRWNSQLIARQVGAGTTGFLNPDAAIGGPHSPSASMEFILLWRNSEKPAGSPFNLTPFAITLNDCPRGTLRPYLCPTDCRLRPDQRAFEMGRYEAANVLKGDQEEKQRATRKAREEGRAPPHRPRWFTAETDGDTGERVWTPARVDGGPLEYWVEREQVWKHGGRKEWAGVEPIFIEEPDFIREAL